MAWEKVQTQTSKKSEWFEWTGEEGQSVSGVLKEVKQGRFNKFALINTGEEEVAVPLKGYADGPKVEDVVATLKPGVKIKIIYVGKRTSKRGRPVSCYEVFTRED